MSDCITCGKPAVIEVDMRPEFTSVNFYCQDHIPVGFNGIIPAGYEVIVS